MSRTWAFYERLRVPDVNDPDRDHMVRWRLIQTPWFVVYLHRLHTPDEARPIPHTHPWAFFSLILWGGYTEKAEGRDQEGRRVWWAERSWQAGTVHRLRATDAHTITRLHRSPTWTLILAGPRRREPSWGYWDGDEFTPWDQHPYKAEFDAALAARGAL